MNGEFEKGRNGAGGWGTESGREEYLPLAIPLKPTHDPVSHSTAFTFHNNQFCKSHSMLRPTFLKPLTSRPAIQFGALVLMFLSCVLPVHGDRVAFEGARQNPPAVRSLQPGQVVERELKGGETQLFRVSAEQRQFLRVVVEQRGIDVKLTVSGPIGQRLVEADAPTGEQGSETVSLLADVAGEYRIEVKSEDEKAKPGRYAARLEALRAATEADRNRVAAERTMREAEELSGQRDPAALRRAVQKYEEALPLWRVLNDQRDQAESLASIGRLYQVNLNEPRRAIDPYQQSLPLWRALSDRNGEAQALNNLGIIYNVLNEKQRALEYLKQALPLRRAAATSEDLGQYRILHFATHGFLNSLNPELSGLVLSLMDEQGKPQNGYLLAPEIYNLKLPATELVVLSACQTGLGGEGIVGLTRGFMYAVAPRVVVSLWSVNDRSTADLMKHFYEAMLAKGQPPSAALRSAQLALMKVKQWKSPYFWAAFGLQGEWR
jgi:tetratricopeptide (TPR) repeat protein